MSTTLTLPADLAAALAAEAAKRKTTPDALAAEVLAERFPVGEAKTGRRLSFTAIGESTSGKTSDDAEDMLTEGFGHR